MRLTLIAKGLAAAITALASLQVLAQDLTDHWVSPGEPGWGLSIQHQGNTLFAVLFVYAAGPTDSSGNGAAEWYVAPDVRLEVIEQLSHYRGKLYAVRGSPHPAAFDPAATQPTEVGEITIFRDGPERDGLVTYRIGAAQKSRPIRRMSFAVPELGGTYHVTMSGFVTRSTADSACEDLQPGPYMRRETWVVAPDGADGWRVTRSADDVPAGVEPVEVRQRGSKLHLRLRIQGPPVLGNGFVELDGHGANGWLGFFRSQSDATVTANLGGQVVTLPQCRFDGAFTATRALDAPVPTGN